MTLKQFFELGNCTEEEQTQLVEFLQFLRWRKLIQWQLILIQPQTNQNEFE